MATLRTSVTGGASSGTGDRTVTITPAVGDLLLIYCCVAANTNSTPTCTDNNGSGTYDRVDIMNATIAAIEYRLSVFVRTALMTNTTSTVATVATGSNTAGALVALAVTNITQAGIAAVRSKGSQNNTAAATPAPVLNQTSLTGNMTIVACGSTDTTTTEPSGWTEAQDTSQVSDAVSLEVATRASGFAGTTITFGAACSSVFCSHALELDSVLRVNATDSLNNWADTNGRTLGGATPLTQGVSDSLNFWDDDPVGSKQPRWRDANANNLGTPTTTPLTQTASDSLNNWQDSAVGDKLARWRDTTTATPSGVTPLTKSVSDSLNFWSDAASELETDYLVLAGDSLNNWADANARFLAGTALQVSVSDSLNNWADARLADRQPRWRDTNTTQAVSSGQLTKSVADAMGFLTDGTITLGVDHEVLPTDDLNNWADAVTTSTGGAGLLSRSVSDSLNNWVDARLLDKQPRWRDAVNTATGSSNALPVSRSDTLGPLVDGTITLGFDWEVLPSEDLNNWADAVTTSLGSAGLLTKAVSDSLNNWADTQRLGYGLLTPDNLNNWADSVNKTLFGAQIGIQVADSVNNWADSLLLSYGLKLTDSNLLTDSFVVTRLPVTLTKSVSDSLNFWADSFQRQLVSGSDFPAVLRFVINAEVTYQAVLAGDIHATEVIIADVATTQIVEKE